MGYHTLGNLITAFFNKIMGNSSHKRSTHDAEAHYGKNTMYIKINRNEYLA